MRSESGKVIGMTVAHSGHGLHLQAPGPEIVEAFLEHVRVTASPETFPTIALTGFPSRGAIEILHRPVEINPKTRGGERAYCPACGKANKWQTNGFLLWAEDAQAIFCIGGDCYLRLENADRIASALNAFDRATQERRRVEVLARIARSAPALISWCDATRPAAAEIAASQVAFFRELPKLRSALSRALGSDAVVSVAQHRDGRFDSEVLGRLNGTAYLRGKWDLGAAIDLAKRTLEDLVESAGADPETWADQLAETPRRRRLDNARSVLANLMKVSERMAEAAAFLAPANVQLLCTWAAKGPPYNFTGTFTATRLRLRADDKVWEARVGTMPSAPLPDGLSELL